MSAAPPTDATATEAEPETGSPPVGALRVLRASAGFLLLGAIGTLSPVATPRDLLHTAPSGLLVHLGALALTGPTLLVAHPFLGLEASPDRLVGALGRAFARAGDLALGLVPFLLFFAATTRLGTLLLAVLLGFVGITALVAAARDLVAAERAAPGASAVVGIRVFRMRALAVAWSVLTLLAAARVGVEVLS